MKLIFLLAVVAWSNAAKLDRTYLPPSHARTSGGSGNFLQTPTSGSSGVAHNANDFGQNGHGIARNGNGFAQSGNGFAQSGNGFAQNGNGFVQNGNGFARNGNADEYGIHANGFDGRPERAQAALERSAAILRQDNDNNGETYSYAYETENGIYAEENGVAVNGVEAQGGYSYTGDDGQVYSVRYTADQNGFVPQGDLPTPPPVPEEILRALEQNARDEAAGIYDDGSYNEAKYSNGDNNQQYSNNFGSYSNSNGASPNANDDDSVVTTSAFFHNQQPQLRGRGFANQGNFGNEGQSSLNNANGARAYLPPHARQNGGANGSNGFGSRNRQPSFNAKNGYQY